MDEQLLIRFLTHTCTSEDLRLVDQWIASGKPNADWLFEMERIWSLKDELRFSDRREIEEAYNRFTLSQGKSKNAKPHFYIYPILKYVAAVIIIGLLGLNLYKNGSTGNCRREYGRSAERTKSISNAFRWNKDLVEFPK